MIEVIPQSQIIIGHDKVKRKKGMKAIIIILKNVSLAAIFNCLKFFESNSLAKRGSFSFICTVRRSYNVKRDKNCLK